MARPPPPPPSSSSSSATASSSRLRHPLPPPPPASTRLPPPSSSSSSRGRSHEARSAYPSWSEGLHAETSPMYASSHPSPVSTSGSSVTSSSVRTPPDLLVQGSSSGGQSGAKLAVNSWNGQAVQPRSARRLHVGEIRARKRLLAQLPALPLLQLPSPPPSPPPVHKRPREQRSARASWSPSTLAASAEAYRTAARELKHAADARPTSAAPAYVANRPTELSALQQLDAVLLFCYAFWLDDQTADGCVARNWISLFGLLRFATNAHADLGNDVLLGICRLVEAAVLRKLHAHETARLLQRLATSIEPDEVGKAVERQTEDLERADRLAAQARNLLSFQNLANYPRLYEAAVASTLPNTEASAKRADPAAWPQCMAFPWPLDPITPLPLIVCFGRAAVHHHAVKTNVDFHLVSIAC